MTKFFKITISIIFIIYIASKHASQTTICNIHTALQAIPPRLFAEQTIDGSAQSVIFTRFIHNKLGIFGSEFTRCYFYSLDPNFIYHSVGIGIISWVYFAYIILIKKQYLPLGIFLTVPAFPFFTLPIIIVSYTYKIFAIIGLLLLLFKRK